MLLKTNKTNYKIILFASKFYILCFSLVFVVFLTLVRSYVLRVCAVSVCGDSELLRRSFVRAPPVEALDESLRFLVLERQEQLARPLRLLDAHVLDVDLSNGFVCYSLKLFY